MNINKLFKEELESICGGALHLVDGNAAGGITASLATMNGGIDNAGEHSPQFANSFGVNTINNNGVNAGLNTPRGGTNRASCRASLGALDECNALIP